MCLALGFKSALFCGQVRPANTQQMKTRAWDTVQSVDATAHQHARNYSMAKEAYLQIQQAYGAGPELPQLCLADLCISTAILDAAEVRQRNTQLHGFGASAQLSIKMGHGWTNCLVSCVHWLWEKAQFERWLEEQASIHNESMWVPAYFHSKAEQWKEQMLNAENSSQHGHAAYVSQKMGSWEELSRSSEKTLALIISTPLRSFKTALLYLI
ncbi:hypothetical protein V8E53_010960 [Lactarius tabidus]